MSAFHGASHNTFYGGNFTASNNTHVNASGSKGLSAQLTVFSHNADIIEILASHSANAGLLDAVERFGAPRCSDGTRISMIVEMKRFVQQDGPSSIFWLHGPAGMGKSAVAQSLALSLKDEGDHAASFFFSRTAPGRNNGNQLIATLACQLAINIPEIKPFLSKVVKENPLIFNATNAVKMQSLIVDPINHLHRMSRRDPRMWARKVMKRKLHPRLILVDGLDECNDPQVQRDLLLCIANAVARVSLPFRFVIASRPESQILDTFEHDPAFSDSHGAKVLMKNLADDDDADAQIATFLVREFSEIRRTHPIRKYLPPSWPLPVQIEKLVLKSSKGFIYVTTVIRYIKMPRNRPDECLDRILGLSEIPVQDKPYEPLDELYRHIFESVPDDNKESVRNIFHFLVIPDTEPQNRAPPLIERLFNFKPGHVEHVLRDLLCVVAFNPLYPDRELYEDPSSVEDGITITVLHASLPDFLLDHSRSGPISIDIGDAHAVLVASLLRSMSEQDNGLRSDEFSSLGPHLIRAHVTDILFRAVNEFDVAADYRRSVGDGPNNMNDFTTIQHLIRYIQLLACKQFPTSQIMALVSSVESDILRTCPLASALRPLDDKIIQYVVGPIFPYLLFEYCPDCSFANFDQIPRLSQGSWFNDMTAENPDFVGSELANNISRLHVLLLTEFFFSPNDGFRFITGSDTDGQISAPSEMDAHIACRLSDYVVEAGIVVDPKARLLRSLAIKISVNFLARSMYSASLISASQRVLDHLREIQDNRSSIARKYECSNVEALAKSWFQDIAMFIIGYLERIELAQAATPQIEGTQLADLICQYQVEYNRPYPPKRRLQSYTSARSPNAITGFFRGPPC